MSTLGDIATWAYSKINRDDLALVAVQEAAIVYRTICSRVPFPELQRKTPEIPVTISNPVVNLAGYTEAGDVFTLDKKLAGIISIRITYGANQYRRLRKSNARVFDAFASYPPGRPAVYARFGNTLELHPVPDSGSYTLRIRYWMRPVLPDSPSDYDTVELLFPEDWDELARWETLYRMYTHTEQHDKAALLMQVVPMPRQPSPFKTRTFEMGVIPRLWNDLLKTTEQRENVDEDFSINPLARRYTHG